MARQGKKVLLIDADPQGSLTATDEKGIAKMEDLPVGKSLKLYSLMTTKPEEVEKRERDGVI